MEWMLMPLKRYAEFSGRSQRKEYWMYTLGLLIVAFVLGAMEGVMGVNRMVLGVYGPLTALFALATFLPSLAVSIRRLHDTDRSGWWMLSIFGAYCVVGVGAATASASLAMIGGLIVLAVAIMLLVFLVMDGTPGPNRFGPNPKDPAAGAEVFS